MKIHNYNNVNATKTTLVSNKGKFSKAFYYTQVGGDDISGVQSLSVNIKADAGADELRAVSMSLDTLMQNGNAGENISAYRLQKILLQEE